MSRSSLINYYLQNNEEPGDAELQGLTRSRVKPQQELDDTNAEITRIMEILSILEDKREVLSKVVEELDIVLSPMRRVPVDVLREIFFFYLPSDPEAPLHLSQICRSWRSVVLSTPMMWSNVYVKVGSPLYPPPDGQDRSWEILQNARIARQATFLQEWINRSGECYLTVNINVSVNFSSVYVPILEVLMESCHRWKELHCSNQYHAKDLWMRFVSTLRKNGRVMGSLKTLELFSLDCESSWGETYLHGLDSKTMPSLHTLSFTHALYSPISNLLTESSPEIQHPIWPNIRSLSINSREPVDALQILDMCPNIAQAEVSLHMYPSRRTITQGPPHPISLHALRSLHIRKAGNSGVFYDALDTPNINTITVYPPTPSENFRDADILPLVNYIQRTPSLRALVFEFPGKATARGISDLVPEILNCSPQISHLTLKVNPKWDSKSGPTLDLYTGQIQLLLRALSTIATPETQIEPTESGSMMETRRSQIPTIPPLPLPNLHSLELFDLPTGDEDLLAFIINRRRALGATTIADPGLKVAVLRSIKASGVITTSESRIDFADRITRASTRDVLPETHPTPLYLDISYS